MLCLLEVRDEYSSRSVVYSQTVTHRRENSETIRTRQSSEMSIDEYQTRLTETQNLHVKACQETSSLKREVHELRTRLQIQQRRLDYEARKNILEEHKTALMLLRGRRIADGGHSSHAGSSLRVISGQSQCLSPELTEATSHAHSSPEVKSPNMQRFCNYAHPEVEGKFRSGLKRVRTEVTTDTEISPSLKFIAEPEMPLMISVATSTDDLCDLDTDEDLPKENEWEGKGNDWTIRESMLCREEAEGRSRSASPFYAEKQNYNSRQGSRSKCVYPLDEEVREWLFN